MSCGGATPTTLRASRDARRWLRHHHRFRCTLLPARDVPGARRHDTRALAAPKVPALGYLLRHSREGEIVGCWDDFEVVTRTFSGAAPPPVSSDVLARSKFSQDAPGLCHMESKGAMGPGHRARRHTARWKSSVQPRAAVRPRQRAGPTAVGRLAAHDGPPGAAAHGERQVPRRLRHVVRDRPPGSANPHAERARLLRRRLRRAASFEGVGEFPPPVFARQPLAAHNARFRAADLRMRGERPDNKVLVR